jgi:acyl dehydratase
VLRLRGLRPDPRHVARYAEVVGQPPTDRLPLLYPHLLGFGLQLKLMTDPAFPFPALGLVHVTNTVTVTRPLPLASALDVAVHAGAVRPHPRGRVVDLVTTVGCQGETVWTETSSYLHRGGSGSGERAGREGGGREGGAGSGGQAGGETGPGSGEQGGRPDPDGLHLSARWRLGADLGRRYAAVSGDLNPIHLSAWTARPLGFPRAIAHGMWTAAAVLGALEGRLPDALGYTASFRRPITLPATVELFTALRDDGVRAQVRGPDGRLHLDAELVAEGFR